MDKITFQYDKDVTVEVKIGHYYLMWDAIRAACDKLEARGLSMSSYKGKVTWES